jgi:hypothetical protein
LLGNLSDDSRINSHSSAYKLRHGVSFRTTGSRITVKDPCHRIFFKVEHIR